MCHILRNYYLLRFIVVKYLKGCAHKLSCLSIKTLCEGQQWHRVVIIFGEKIVQGLGATKIRPSWVTELGFGPSSYHRAFPRHCSSAPREGWPHCGHPLSCLLTWRLQPPESDCSISDTRLEEDRAWAAKGRQEAGLEGELVSSF